jgi:spore germination cell wall hydrolase CwlJ-like protein
VTPLEIRTALADQDALALTVTLYGEAAGEPVEGQIAVANAVRNRVRSPIRWWGTGTAGVCLQAKQFSCWNVDKAGAPDAPRVYAIAETLLRGEVPAELALVQQLRWIATGIIAGQLQDNTRGANHYLTSRLLRATPPDWAIGRTPVAEIGAHSFFRIDA